MAICVGCGLAVNGSGVLIVDRNPDSVGSGLDCSDSLGLSIAIQHTDGTCVTTTGLGTSGSPLHADINLADANSGLICDGTGLRVDVSEDACNGIAIRANGLYSPCPDGVITVANHTSPQSASLPFSAVGVNNTYNFNSLVVRITNNTCCSVEGQIVIRVGGLFGTAHPGFFGSSHIQTSVTGGPPFFDAAPSTNKVIHNVTASNWAVDFNNTEEINYLALGPGAFVDYMANFLILANVGTIDLFGTVDFEWNGVLVQTGCC